MSFLAGQTGISFETANHKPPGRIDQYLDIGHIILGEHIADDLFPDLGNKVVERFPRFMLRRYKNGNDLVKAVAIELHGHLAFPVRAKSFDDAPATALLKPIRQSMRKFDRQGALNSAFPLLHSRTQCPGRPLPALFCATAPAMSLLCS